MFDIPLPLANVWYGVANVALILGAMLAVVGTVGSIWMGSIRELHTERRVSENEAQTATANQRTEELRKGNAKLQIELEKERSERLRLEKRLKPRRLSEADKHAFHNALSVIGPDRVSVTHAMSDPEAERLSADLLEAFQKAGWEQEQGVVSAMWMPAQYGVAVALHPEEAGIQQIITNKAGNIATLFHAAGLMDEVILTRSDAVVQGTVQINVGHKPA